MKKFIIILATGMLWCNVGFADPLGIGEKRLDINFDCELNVDFLVKAGVPKDKAKSMAKNKPPKFGYKEYNHPDDDFVLIHLNFNEGEYSFPKSIATRWKSKSQGGKFFYVSFIYGFERIFEYKNEYLGEEDFLLLKNLYKVDKKNARKFDKKYDKLTKLPDDDFVKSLALLTKDFYDYVKENKGKRIISLPYNCKAS